MGNIFSSTEWNILRQLLTQLQNLQFEDHQVINGILEKLEFLGNLQRNHLSGHFEWIDR